MFGAVVLLTKLPKILVPALEVLHDYNASKTGLLDQTEFHSFTDLLDDTIQSVHTCGEDDEITKTFTHLGRVVHNDGGPYQKVTRRIALAHEVMDLLNTNMWHC